MWMFWNRAMLSVLIPVSCHKSTVSISGRDVRVGWRRSWIVRWWWQVFALRSRWPIVIVAIVWVVLLRWLRIWQATVRIGWVEWTIDVWLSTRVAAAAVSIGSSARIAFAIVITTSWHNWQLGNVCALRTKNKNEMNQVFAFPLNHS